MKAWKVTITLQEPFCCAQRPVVGNEIESVDHIPATVLRGALAQWLAAKGRADELGEWFGLDNAPQYSPAWPTGPGDHTLVPMPLSYYRDKGDEGFGGRFGVHNSLWGTPPAQEGDHCFQWTRLASGPVWLAVDSSGQPVTALRAELEAAMHVALHYGRQSSREGALFSRAALKAGTTLVSYVVAPDGVPRNGWPAEPITVFLGKRRSAGNGMAQLTFAPIARLPWQAWTAQPPPAGDQRPQAVVQLLTDTLVPSEHGGWLRGLDEAAWQRILGLNDLKVEAAFSAFKAIMGWSVTWGLPREQSTAIVAGSCWRISSADPDFKNKLADLAQNGLGVRRNEGFGWVAVNPVWLLSRSDGSRFGHGSSLKIGSPKSTGEPLPWPAAAGIERDRVRKLVQLARQIEAQVSGVEGARPKLVGLCNYAKRQANSQAVQQFVGAFAGREHPRGWDKIKEALACAFGECTEINELRFLLEIVAGLLPRQE